LNVWRHALEVQGEQRGPQRTCEYGRDVVFYDFSIRKRRVRVPAFGCRVIGEDRGRWGGVSIDRIRSWTGTGVGGPVWIRAPLERQIQAGRGE